MQYWLDQVYRTRALAQWGSSRNLVYILILLPGVSLGAVAGNRRKLSKPKCSNPPNSIHSRHPVLSPGRDVRVHPPPLEAAVRHACPGGPRRPLRLWAPLPPSSPSPPPHIKVLRSYISRKFVKIRLLLYLGEVSVILAQFMGPTKNVNSS